MSDRHKSQRQRILELLQAAGPRGCSNLLLNEVCFRYGGRIHELRKEWEIETKQESENVFRFILHGKRAVEQQRLWGEVV
jgi:hypothetical protein